MTADSLFNGSWFPQESGYSKRDSTDIDTIILDHKKQSIRLIADRQLAQAPMREDLLDSMEQWIKASVDSLLPGYHLEILSGKTGLRALVPNYYRSAMEKDATRSVKKYSRKTTTMMSAVAGMVMTS